MRIGLIADIHGNLIALESVLSELKREQVDHIICLGDVAALGPQPLEVLERLRELNCPVVMGNTDDWYLQPFPGGVDELREIVGWGLQQLTDADADLEQPMKSPRPWCFSHPTTAVTSREQNCVWMAVFHKCRP